MIYCKAIKFLICLSVLLSSDGLADNSSYPPDITKILDRGYLIVAMSSDERPPFFTASNPNPKELQGIDADLAKNIGENLGVKVVFLRDLKNFDDVINQVVSGKADIAISKLSFTYARAKKAHYSTKYATLYKSLLINRVSFPKIVDPMDDQKAQLIFDNPNIVIGVMKETSYVHFAKHLFPKAQILPMEKWEDILDLLNNKKISAAFWDDLEFEKYLRDNPDKFLSLKVLKFKGEKDTLHIITPWNSQQLSNFVDMFLTYNDINYFTDGILKHGQKKDK